MKRLIPTVFVLIFVIFLNFGCTENPGPCEDKVCENGGECFFGACECAPGYRGLNCENYDPNQVQALLDAGKSIQELLDSGVEKESFYGVIYDEGYIFLLNDDGTGMVAALEDQSINIEWGCRNLDISTLENITECFNDCFQPESGEFLESTRVGDGFDNTNKIIAECNEPSIAARIARNLGEEWFLPSRGEMNLIYQNIFTKGVGNFIETSYWTSTENQNFSSWRVLFFNYGQNKLEFKDERAAVRAAKTF